MVISVQVMELSSTKPASMTGWSLLHYQSKMRTAQYIILRIDARTGSCGALSGGLTDTQFEHRIGVHLYVAAGGASAAGAGGRGGVAARMAPDSTDTACDAEAAVAVLRAARMVRAVVAVATASYRRGGPAADAAVLRGPAPSPLAAAARTGAAAVAAGGQHARGGPADIGELRGDLRRQPGGPSGCFGCNRRLYDVGQHEQQIIHNLE